MGAHQNTFLVTQSGNLGPKETNIAKCQKGHRETDTYKHKDEQGRGIWYKRNKRKRSRKGRIRVSRYEYACAYMEHACTTHLYAYAYFEYSCTCKKHAYAYMPQKTLTQKSKNALTKKWKTNNLTCFISKDKENPN